MADTETPTKAEQFTLTLELDMAVVDSRGALPSPLDIMGWQQVIAEMIDNIDGVPVCTNPDDVCKQHISQMEDTDWRIGMVTVLRAEHDGIYKNLFVPTRPTYAV